MLELRALLEQMNKLNSNGESIPEEMEVKHIDFRRSCSNPNTNPPSNPASSKALNLTVTVPVTLSLIEAKHDALQQDLSQIEDRLKALHEQVAQMQVWSTSQQLVHDEPCVGDTGGDV